MLWESVNHVEIKFIGGKERSSCLVKESMMLKGGLPYLDRYDSIGGIESAYQRYLNREVTLRSLGDLTGVSKQTIRNDLVRFFGLEKYEADIETMRQKRIGKFTSLQDAIEFVTSKIADRPSKEQREKLRLLAKALSIVGKSLGEGIEIDLTSLRSPCIITRSGRKVSLRFAEVHEKLADYKTGFYRFNIRKIILRFDFVAFIIFYKRKTLIYLLPSREIYNRRSLPLPFKMRPRHSKYSKALNDWSLLKT